ncbi:hypothetical protein ACB092_03G156400 [Castanea dentata]
MRCQTLPESLQCSEKGLGREKHTDDYKFMFAMLVKIDSTIKWSNVKWVLDPTSWDCGEYFLESEWSQR